MLVHTTTMLLFLVALLADFADFVARLSKMARSLRRQFDQLSGIASQPTIVSRASLACNTCCCCGCCDLSAIDYKAYSPTQSHTPSRERTIPSICPSPFSSHPPLSTTNLLVTTVVLPLVLAETVQAEVSHGVVAANVESGPDSTDVSFTKIIIIYVRQ